MEVKMKRLLISMVVTFVLLLSVNVQAGQPLGSPRHWIAPPNSMAFGNSLDDWMLAWVGWLDAGADPAVRIRNVAFLPIIPGPEFEVKVKVGTALVLPVATWLGEDENDTLPDEWFGDPSHVFGELSLNGGPIVEINEDYYVGPTPIEPPLFDFYVLYQALACVILPLPAGVHEVELHSEFVDFGAVFDNSWTITVVP
jgi:hypothetical protein